MLSGSAKIESNLAGFRAERVARDWERGNVQGRITIELTAEIPDTGSRLPDLAHTAYWLKKELPELTFTDKDGKDHRIGDRYEVTRISADAGAI